MTQPIEKIADDLNQICMDMVNVIVENKEDWIGHADVVALRIAMQINSYFRKLKENDPT